MLAMCRFGFGDRGLPARSCVKSGFCLGLVLRFGTQVVCISAARNGNCAFGLVIALLDLFQLVRSV
jgi:hypothetical protein